MSLIYRNCIYLYLHSFPTRRSSDLTFVKDWFRYESHFVHGRDSLVDILKERGLQENLYHEQRSEERFSRNAETDLVCRLLLEKKKLDGTIATIMPNIHSINLIRSRT